MHADLSQSLSLGHGPDWPARIGLAPLTNHESHADGTVGDFEFRFLGLRAAGGFRTILTCAAHVQQGGQGFPGQMGCWSDDHIEGLARLATALHDAGAICAVQLQHSGERSAPALTGQPPVAPWEDAAAGVRALSTQEVERLVEDFAAAARRCDLAGFDGAELHGAHGYLLGEFLDARRNARTDRYGGSYENRTRIFREIIAAVRDSTGPRFQLGLRLSPEKFGCPIDDALRLATELLADDRVDYLDMSLLDSFKEPDDTRYRGRRLIDIYGALPRGGTRLGVTGMIDSAQKAADCLAAGADFVLIGRPAIIDADFARRALGDPAFAARPCPVTRAHLESQAVGPDFMRYLGESFGYLLSD